MTQGELSNLITFNPWTISEDTSLEAVVRMLNEMDFHHWPVVDDQRRLVGILSEVDIMRAVQQLAQSHAPVTVGGPSVAPSTIDAFVSRRVITVGPNDSKSRALQRLLQHWIHALPVVEDSVLIGMITSTDFLREFSYGELTGGHEQVCDCLAKVSCVIDVEASLDEAFQVMHDGGADHIGVVRGQCPLGVISRRELRKAKCRRTACQLMDEELARVGPTTLAELVENAPTLGPGQTLRDAASMMLECRCQAVGVVNQAHRLMGLISEDIVLQAMLQHMS